MKKLTITAMFLIGVCAFAQRIKLNHWRRNGENLCYGFP